MSPGDQARLRQSLMLRLLGNLLSSASLAPGGPPPHGARLTTTDPTAGTVGKVLCRWIPV